MVRLMTEWERQLERFAKAVASGVPIYSGPETARRMNDLFRSRGMDYRVQSSPFIEEGELVAVRQDGVGFGGLF